MAWRVQGTANFRWHWFGDRPLDSTAAQSCEVVRGQLVQAWFPAEEDATWTPKCDIVLHGTKSSYREAVGLQADCTVAACTLRFASGTVSDRRIDVCASARLACLFAA